MVLSEAMHTYCTFTICIIMIVHTKMFMLLSNFSYNDEKECGFHFAAVAVDETKSNYCHLNNNGQKGDGNHKS